MKKEIICVLFIIFCIVGCQSSRSYVFELDINGVVSEKIIYKENHNSHNIWVHQFNGSLLVIGREDFEGIWENVEVGDTLVKPSQTLDLTVRKANGEQLLLDFVYDPTSFKLF